MTSESRQYVNDAWYVAGWSSEFTRALNALVILEQPLLAYRCEDGSVAIVEDRCPHR